MDMIDAMVLSALIMVLWGLLSRLNNLLRDNMVAKKITDNSLFLTIHEVVINGEVQFEVKETTSEQLVLKTNDINLVISTLHTRFSDKNIFFSTDSGKMLGLFVAKDKK